MPHLNSLPLAEWDISGVTDMSDLSKDCGSTGCGSYWYYVAFNADLSSWDTSSVTDMAYAFYHARSFNSTLEAWDVSRVTSMNSMFSHCTHFNSPLTWDTSSVTTMEYMFSRCKRLNSPLYLDTSSVTTMKYMFQDAYLFESSSIASWDVSQVKSMESMFTMQNYNYFYYDDFVDTSAGYFEVDISAWNVKSVTNFDAMFYSYPSTSSINTILCWDLDFSNPITVANMFGSDGTYLIDPTAAKCACKVNEFYDGTVCAACAPGTISFGKTESCIECTDFLCPPSPSPTVSAIPSVTPVPTATPEPSAHPTPTPTTDPTMVQVTEISSSYVSTPAVRTEILHAEEIMLNGVELSSYSSSNRRLTAGSEVLSNLVEEIQGKQEAMMAHINAQRTMIESLRKTNDAQQEKIDAQQAKIDIQQATLHDHQTSIAEFKVRL